MSLFKRSSKALATTAVGMALLLSACGEAGTMEDHVRDLNDRIQYQLNVFPDAKQVIDEAAASAIDEDSILVEVKLANNPAMESFVKDFINNQGEDLIEQANTEVQSTIGKSQIESLDVRLKVVKHNGEVIFDKTTVEVKADK
ncbi:hypothetical protein NXS08_01695 [Gleimia sp. 6138-11-ORH1]|uniref:hypothetical protein n=1 Tax=Gleimia sp. 6138-11-ORH1 TaxID=2973937 RepID=UPI0021672806|nr:hypothetical protein [Gleimia sp. 6138-11-ORH1]MCS4484206.1 hypothetical protein [Gleimia sp. 6138-11-ORH1]